MTTGTMDVVKGRIEEAAGALTGNDKLRARGQTDQAMGHVKQASEKVVRQARESARKMVADAQGVAQKAVDKARSKV
jgi:uncharacterized protein YjbJ (UPF0337 family)